MLLLGLPGCVVVHASSSEKYAFHPAAKQSVLQSGLLTAGDVDDNLNFRAFVQFSNRSSIVQHYTTLQTNHPQQKEEKESQPNQQQKEEEKEQSIASSNNKSRLLDLSQRIAIRVSDGQGKAYSGAIVEVVVEDDDDKNTNGEGDGGLIVEHQYPVGSNGKLYLYPSLEGFETMTTLTLRARDSTGSCPGTNCSEMVAITPTKTSLSKLPITNMMTATMEDAADSNAGYLNLIVAEGVATLPQQLDVAFVIDTTGSMCDELSYIQAELKSVIHTVAAGMGNDNDSDSSSTNTNLDIRVAIVVYRDEGDAYVVRTTPFNDIETAVEALQQEACGGGGDWPEAMDQALQASAETLVWRESGTVARVLFVLADAPPHDEHLEVALQHVLALKRLGVRVYGLAGSGVDETLEYFLRLLSLVTGGRYLFLTDDSGIGNTHAEPSIVCYQVTRLDQLLVRVLQSELTGERVEPDPEDIIRESGTQERGVCIVDFEPIIDIEEQANIVTEGIESVADASYEGDVSIADATYKGGDVSIAVYSSDAAAYYTIIHGKGSFMYILFMMLSVYTYVVWS